VRAHVKFHGFGRSESRLRLDGHRGVAHIAAIYHVNFSRSTNRVLDPKWITESGLLKACPANTGLDSPVISGNLVMAGFNSIEVPASIHNANSSQCAVRRKCGSNQTESTFLASARIFIACTA
jgi:hypothetical protein